MKQSEISCFETGWQQHSAPTPETSIPQITLVPVGIPPKMLAALQVPNKPSMRYVCLTYQATNCYVEHICGGHTNSFWVYSAFIDHFAVAIHLIGCDLGSDDSYPTYGLLLDQQQNQVWLAQYSHIKKFLKNWQSYAYPEPKLTREQQEQISKKGFEKLMQSVKEFRQPSPKELSAIVEASMHQEQDAIAAITAYLDAYLPEAITIAQRRVAAATQNQDREVMSYLSLLLARFLNKYQNN
ncbi:hypothetical protein [Phormidium sp. CCY1219]|uniref:hypothetical protein n=1 Tax=Phormidium sp. CCY1219 TaxID=2886104 RepID=UPI002D1F7E4B|nr:hypothetical protein [Phormidium sp. CCY1219]MEB3830108.1 hypothetical protein [Phormidium sp. CCY1219]